jgi:predicted RNase H-like HicB family nuclease
MSKRMTTNGHHRNGHGGASADADRGSLAYAVIVHPAGDLDDPNAARFWTEVPALAACTAAGATVEEAVENTRQSVARWLAYQANRAQPAPAPPQFELDVALAF